MAPLTPVFLRGILLGVVATAILYFVFGSESTTATIFSLLCVTTFVSLFTVLIQFAVNHSKRVPPLSNGEEILRSELSVHGKAFKDAGGWLFLTNHNLRFKSHFFSSKKREFELPLAGIRVVEQIGKDKLLVKMVNGDEEQFKVVSSPLIWAEAIAEATGKKEQGE